MEVSSRSRRWRAAIAQKAWPAGGKSLSSKKVVHFVIIDACIEQPTVAVMRRTMRL